MKELEFILSEIDKVRESKSIILVDNTIKDRIEKIFNIEDTIKQTHEIEVIMWVRLFYIETTNIYNDLDLYLFKSKLVKKEEWEYNISWEKERWEYDKVLYISEKENNITIQIFTYEDMVKLYSLVLNKEIWNNWK